MVDLAAHVARYLQQTLGVDARLGAWADVGKLALFLTERYRLYTLAMLNTHALVMVDTNAAEEPVGVIGKHIAQVQALCRWPVIYARSAVSGYGRRRLIEQRIPFIVPGNQMYLPDLGIDLRERFGGRVNEGRTFRAATQAAWLHILLGRVDRKPTVGELAAELGYSAMTMSRAIDELEAAGLAEGATEGRTRRVRLAATRREVGERSLARLATPVRERLFVLHGPEMRLGLRAGLSALASYSMIAEPVNPTFAVGREQWLTLMARGGVEVVPVAEPDASVVEIWTYPPRPFLVAGVVDPLSLYASLRVGADERTDQALRLMLGEIPW